MDQRVKCKKRKAAKSVERNMAELTENPLVREILLSRMLNDSAINKTGKFA